MKYKLIDYKKIAKVGDVVRITKLSTDLSHKGEVFIVDDVGIYVSCEDFGSSLRTGVRFDEEKYEIEILESEPGCVFEMTSGPMLSGEPEKFVQMSVAVNSESNIVFYVGTTDKGRVFKGLTGGLGVSWQLITPPDFSKF